MKYTWEETDIDCGRRVWSSSDGECLIGYRRHGTNMVRLVLISLDDGLVAWECKNRSDFASELNAHGYRPLDVRDVPRKR